MGRLLYRLLWPLALGPLVGCAALGTAWRDGPAYYWQSVQGHVRVMQAARPVDEVLADPTASERLKAQLRLAQRIRAFAVTDLHLPDNASYRRYADLRRPAVVWNVVAAPEWSLTLTTWCFPLTGCVGYRGYFAEADARAKAAELQASGLEVSVYGVPAYSTLGWLNWAGGDPLLNTFLGYPEGELARMVFHELAHQVVFAPGDTVFNESFATAVERLGGALWLDRHAGPEALAAFRAFDERRNAFRALTLATRQRLAEVYALAPTSVSSISPVAPVAQANGGPPDPAGPTTPADVLALKHAAMADFRAAYQTLKAGWGGHAGYDAWVARANNAAFGAQAAYDELVPGFEALFEREGRDWPRFYDAVKRLAALDPAERRAALRP